MLLTAASGYPGASGNAITVSVSASSAGIYTYGGIGTLGGGVDTTCVINGTSFVANFDTDANTTVGDLITAIGLSGPISALVTPTLVSGQMLLTAVSNGIAGNAITTTGNGQFGSGFTSTVFPQKMSGGFNGALQNSIPVICLGTVPPFGQAPGYTMAKDTQRTTLNGFISAWVMAHSGAGAVLADADSTLRDPAAHQNIDATYLSSDNININDAGHAALYTLFGGLLP